MRNTPQKRKPTGAATTAGNKAKHTHVQIVTQVADELTLTTTTTEPRADSRLLAKQLGIQAESAFKLVKDYRANFEELGKVRFEIGASPGSRTGQTVKFAMLNEDQSFLLLTYSRNTARVRGLKVKLVKAFGEARRAADLRHTDYLPGYHAMHDQFKTLAAGSPNERFMHINCNKELNKFAGLAAGQRAGAPLPTQALLIVGQMTMTQAMQSAHNHHDGFQRAKASLLALTACTMLESTP